MVVLPAQGDGPIDATPSAYTGQVVSVAGDEIRVVAPDFSSTRIHTARYAAPRGTPAPGDSCVVLFTEGQPFVVTEGRGNAEGAWVNAERYGYVGDGVVNDTAAIVAALAALPPYSGGAGGGTVMVPSTPTNVCKVDVSEIVLDDGQRLIGAGMKAPRLLGNGAGSVVEVVGDYTELAHLYVQNQHADAAARAMYVHDNSDFTAERVYFQSANVGGEIVKLHFAVLATFDRTKMGGAGTGVCDVALLAESSCNGLSLRGARFANARSGVMAYNLYTLSVTDACQFESLVGGGTFDGGLIISGVYGGAISGNYFEACASRSIITRQNIDTSDGVVIGGNTFLSQVGGSEFVNLDGGRGCAVLPNFYQPGAGTPNLNGVKNQGTYAHTNDVSPQRLYSGTGKDVVGFRGGGSRAGTGSPEGVVTGYRGDRWFRTDGGASTTFYVKETGDNTNTGWAAK